MQPEGRGTAVPTAAHRPPAGISVAPSSQAQKFLDIMAGAPPLDTQTVAQNRADLRPGAAADRRADAGAEVRDTTVAGAARCVGRRAGEPGAVPRDVRSRGARRARGGPGPAAGAVGGGVRLADRAGRARRRRVAGRLLEAEFEVPDMNPLRNCPAATSRSGAHSPLAVNRTRTSSARGACNSRDSTVKLVDVAAGDGRGDGDAQRDKVSTGANRAARPAACCCSQAARL